MYGNQTDTETMIVRTENIEKYKMIRILNFTCVWKLRVERIIGVYSGVRTATVWLS